MPARRSIDAGFDREWQDRYESFGRTQTSEHGVSGWSAEGLARRFRLFECLLAELPVPSAARVLELGCGAGTYVRYLAIRGHQVIGVDYASSSLGRALEADPGRKGRYVVAAGYHLPFEPEAFDLVMCVGVLQTVGEPERLVDEIARVLRPRGLVVLEALNALSLPARVTPLLEMLGRRPPRVRFYSPFAVERWLARRHIRCVHRAEVYLPPRRCPGLGSFLDRAGLRPVLEGIPGVPFLAAHAFWLIGEKA